MWFRRIGEELDNIQLSNEQIIELKKKSSRIIAKARELAKEEKCLYCNQRVSSFCNSHSIPDFCLRNIDVNGKLNSSNLLMELPILKDTTGISNSGTFHLICNKCDSIIFKDYENSESLESKSISQKMLAQIAMKNLLKMIDKRKFEIALYSIMLEEIFNKEIFMRKKICELDLSNYMSGYEIAKKASTDKLSDKYFLIYSDLLDYVVPIAYQGTVALISDLKGNIVNDIYNKSDKYIVQDLHIGVFPLKDKTSIIMFVNNGSMRYKNFCRQFKRLSREEKLGVINYIIFLYTEDYFISKQINESIDFENLKTIAKKSTIAYTENFENSITIAGKEFNLSKWNIIENLLDEKFKLR